MYYTYMLRCSDNSIYTGMTNNLENRLNEHLSKGKNGAKYTKSHNVIKLEAARHPALQSFPSAVPSDFPVLP